MGKRKFKEEPKDDDADVVVVAESVVAPQTEATTARQKQLQQDQFREPRLKRLKREHHQQQHIEEAEEEHANDGRRQALDNGWAIGPSSSSAAIASSSNLLPNGRGSLSAFQPLMNGVNTSVRHSSDAAGDSDSQQQQSVWLIRKPINMPMEALQNIHFTRKQSAQCQTLTTKSAKVECQLKKPIRPMLHVISDRKRNFDEKVPMTQGSCLRGVVWINSIESVVQRRSPSTTTTTTNTTPNDETEGADGVAATGELLHLDDDDGGNAEDDDDGIFCATAVPSSSHIQIGSIRRKPVIDERVVKERLKAFGNNGTTKAGDGDAAMATEVKKMRRRK